MATSNSSVIVTLDTKGITAQLRAVIEALSNIDLSATAFTAEAAAKKAHDDLRTSPIALKALALYNRECIGYGPYESWDATCEGLGVADSRVKEYIELAEQTEAKEKEAAERLAARRLDIYKELGGAFATNVSWNSPMGKAVLRIIELEDKAA